MNQTIKPSRPILNLKSNHGSSIEKSREFDAYGFKIKIAKDGWRIWPEEFKRDLRPNFHPRLVES